MTKKNLTRIDIVDPHKDKILSVMKKYGLVNVYIFGSVARGQADDESDVDFLVSFSKVLGIEDIHDLRVALQLILKRPVDIILSNKISGKIKDSILKDSIPL